MKTCTQYLRSWICRPESSDRTRPHPGSWHLWHRQNHTHLILQENPSWVLRRKGPVLGGCLLAQKTVLFAGSTRGNLRMSAMWPTLKHNDRTLRYLLTSLISHLLDGHVPQRKDHAHDCNGFVVLRKLDSRASWNYGKMCISVSIWLKSPSTLAKLAYAHHSFIHCLTYDILTVNSIPCAENFAENLATMMSCYLLYRLHAFWWETHFWLKDIHQFSRLLDRLPC